MDPKKAAEFEKVPIDEFLQDHEFGVLLRGALQKHWIEDVHLRQCVFAGKMTSQDVHLLANSRVP